MGLKDIKKAYQIAKSILSGELTLSNLDKMTEQQFDAFTNEYNLTTQSILKGSGVMFQTNAYDYCPPLQAVVNKKAQAITKGKLICVD